MIRKRYFRGCLCLCFSYRSRSGAPTDHLRNTRTCPRACSESSSRDTLLSPVGKPYDTLEEVIGIRPSNGSLAEYGISYKQVELLEDGYFDYPAIEKALEDKTIKLATIQRSKGYQTRPSYSVEKSAN